ncbi:MAG: DUF3488 domain-containing protein [Acidobacteria bacterium]|nr:DUF3488 domain-containing protein [Acidobacteriota bacterium]
MNFAAFLKLFYYQLILAGFLAIYVTGKLDLPSGVLFLAGLALAFLRGDQMAARHRRFSRFSVFLLMLFLMFFFLFDALLVSGEFALAVVHVALIVCLLKLFTRKTGRDHVYLFMIAFGFLLVSSTFSVDMWFLLFASWFLVSGIVILMLNDLRSSSLRFSMATFAGPAATTTEESLATTPAQPGRYLLPSRHFVLLAVGIFLAVILFTAPIFFLLPRLAFGLWQLDLSDRQEISGFSEITTLGDITSIKRNDATVMYVRTSIPPNELPADLKWRGIALDHYDGRNWSLAGSDVTHLHHPPSGAWYTINERKYPETLLYQEIYLEPIASRVLFLAHRQISMSRNIGRVYLSRTQTLVKPHTHFRKFKYFGYSDVARFPLTELLTSPPASPEEVPAPFLEIPTYSHPIENLVLRITAGLDSPYARALRIQDHLRQNYEYSLEMEECPSDEDPIEFFLFRMRRGHCEYYASALAIMLRYSGIPSRLVNGFQRGEINPITETFVVRQNDAHSWVEAYFTGFGWVELDATPPDTAQSRLAILRYLEHLFESVHFFWMSNVVNFDLGDQFRLFNSVRNNAHSWRTTVAEYYQRFQTGISELARVWTQRLHDSRDRSSFWGFRLLGAILLVVLGGAVVVLWRYWRWAYRRRRRVSRHLITRVYQRFQSLAAGAGLRRKAGETPREFAVRTRHVFPAELVDEFTSLYYLLRYGSADIASTTWDRLEDLLRLLRGAQKRGRGK